MARQRERENSVKEEARILGEYEGCKVVQKSMWATGGEPTRRSSALKRLSVLEHELRRGQNLPPSHCCSRSYCVCTVAGNAMNELV